MTFSHDGIHDSLTHLVSPGYFYEELARQIALSERNKEEFSIIRFLLIANEPKDRDTEAINFAQILRTLTRKNECVARMAEDEYVLLIPENEMKTSIVLSRIIQAYQISEGTNSKLSSSVVYHHAQESALDLLNRLDKTGLSTLQ